MLRLLFAVLSVVIFCSSQYVTGLIDGLVGQNCPDNPSPIDFQFDVYHRFREIMAYVDAVGKRYCKIAEVVQIGRTFERNPIKGLKIGSPGSNKPIFLFDANFHAREWLGPATAVYIINQLVTRYNNDSEIRQLLDTYDWYIFPVMNPDGYKYSWASRNNRLWRKNRSIPSLLNPGCRGVDLNRNFPVDFGRQNTNTSVCGDKYPGPFPFSELETRAVKDFMLSRRGRIKAYVTLHTFTQKWVSPYGYTSDLPPDYEKQMKALDIACSAIREVHNQDYVCGTSFTTIYPVSGTVTDWAYIYANITYSFLAEMRDQGRFGHELPSDQIIPNAEENYAGIRALANYLISELQLTR